MTDVENVGSKIVSDLLKNTVANNSAASSKKVSDIISEINSIQKNAKSAFLDKDTIEKLKEGAYGITLKQFTNLNTYNTTMNSLYGNSSNNYTSNYINNILNTNTEDTVYTAKSFIEKMREYGMSNTGALKLYTAISSYSVFSTLSNSATNNYVSTTI